MANVALQTGTYFCTANRMVVFNNLNATTKLKNKLEITADYNVFKHVKGNTEERECSGMDGSCYGILRQTHE